MNCRNVEKLILGVVAVWMASGCGDHLNELPHRSDADNASLAPSFSAEVDAGHGIESMGSNEGGLPIELPYPFEECDVPGNIWVVEGNFEAGLAHAKKIYRDSDSMFGGGNGTHGASLWAEPRHSTDSEVWSLSLHARGSENISVGWYTNVCCNVGETAHDPSGVLGYSGNTIVDECESSVLNAAVRDVELDSQDVRAITLSFVQRCNKGPATVIRGCIHYRYSASPNW